MIHILQAPAHVYDSLSLSFMIFKGGREEGMTDTFILPGPVIVTNEYELTLYL